ncbi:MAG: exopolysaccharide biosynthesis polyprenyl glycosylphosphotransferase [Lachnospiraceae bacterium]
MNKIRHKAVLRVAVLINIILLTCPFVMSWFLYYAGRILNPYYMKGNILVIALFVILYVAFSHTYDAFLISYNRISEMVYSQSLALLISDTVMYIVISLLSIKLVNIGPLILTILTQILFSALWSLVVHLWYFAVNKPRRTAVVYDARRGIEDLIHEYGLSKKFEIVATATASECIEGQMKMLEGMEAVFVCGVHSHDRNVILKYCIANDIRLFVLPRVGDVIMSGAKRMHMFHLPILMVERYNPSMEYLLLKRVFDLFASGLGLVLASPFMIITAIAIKICDGGPVLYHQRRLTKGGKEFDVLKFRSMRVDAEKDGAQLSSRDKDDRITPVGRFIRKVRIDELPQLINILRGDMSVVGPRPERPEIAEEYLKELPEFNLRLQAKAGLTGYAQVYGKYNTTPYDKLQMDLMYISNPSFVEDMKIVLATIKIIFLPDSTEGIAEGQRTAAATEAAAAAEVASTKETSECEQRVMKPKKSETDNNSTDREKDSERRKRT